MAERIQRRRTKGWRMPEGAVFVGRPTRWGNPWRKILVAPEDLPYKVAEVANPPQGPVFRVDNPDAGVTGKHYYGPDADFWLVANYWDHLRANPTLMKAAVVQLEGKDLACWCPPERSCHADALLDVANPGIVRR